jgi:hypothetical protein
MHGHGSAGPIPTVEMHGQQKPKVAGSRIETEDVSQMIHGREDTVCCEFIEGTM